jgi:hypothetical protein
MVSEVSAHSCLAPSFRPAVRQKQHGGREGRKKALHLMIARKQRKISRKGPGTRYTLQSHIPETYFFPLGSIS